MHNLSYEGQSSEDARKQINEGQGFVRNLTRLPKNAPEVAKNAIIKDAEDLQNDIIDPAKEMDKLN